LTSRLQRSRSIVIPILVLNLLAIPTHLLGMSIQPGDTENLASECPMHQDAGHDSGTGDSCECSSGVCSVGSVKHFARPTPKQYQSIFQYPGGILAATFVRYICGEHYIIYHSRAPPPISLS